MTWWLRTDHGRSFIEPLGINDLSSVLKHVLALAGVCMMLIYLTDVYRGEGAAARHVKISSVVRSTAVRASWATALCHVLLFFLALATRASLRTGLAMMAAGMALLVLYSALRISYVMAVTLEPQLVETPTVPEQIIDSLLYAGCTLWLVGSTTPATQVLRNRIRCYKALFTLHPLWRDLVRAADGTALHQPSALLLARRFATAINTVRDLFTHDTAP